MTEPRFAYFVLQSITTDTGEYIPCVAIEGEKGYHLTDWHWGTDFERAEACVKKMNEELGLDEMEATKIVVSTMRE